MRKGREYWSGHVEAWRCSGLSKKSYCEQHDVAYWSLRYWVDKLLSAGESQELVELEAVGVGGEAAEQRAAIELVVDERYVLKLWPSVRAAHLREVLAALEGVR